MENGFSTGLQFCLKTSTAAAISSTGKLVNLIVVGPK